MRSRAIVRKQHRLAPLDGSERIAGGVYDDPYIVPAGVGAVREAFERLRARCIDHRDVTIRKPYRLRVDHRCDRGPDVIAPPENGYDLS